MDNILSALIQAIPAIQTGMKGKNLKPQQRTLGQLQNVTDAQTNMDNPMFQSIYGQNRQAGQADLAGTIAELSRQNRKLVSMGRTPLLDSERGGESIFRNLIQGQEDVGNQARTNTFSQLNNGAAGLRGLYGDQDLLADNDYNNKLKKVGAYYSIGDALKGLFNL